MTNPQDGLASPLGWHNANAGEVYDFTAFVSPFIRSYHNLTSWFIDIEEIMCNQWAQMDAPDDQKPTRSTLILTTQKKSPT